MGLNRLKEKIEKHNGVFACRGIRDESLKKEVKFSHSYEAPIEYSDIPDCGKLKEFYQSFGSLTLYYHEESGDAALYIASPEQWGSLMEEFEGWTQNLDEDEEEELLPPWIDNCICIGEVPSSGNYFLVPTLGEEAGSIYEFEHDGFEFILHASDIEEMIENSINPNSIRLTEFAAHMRFIEGDSNEQWWILEMKDNLGNVVSTDS